MSRDPLSESVWLSNAFDSYDVDVCKNIDGGSGGAICSGILTNKETGQKIPCALKHIPTSASVEVPEFKLHAELTQGNRSSQEMGLLKLIGTRTIKGIHYAVMPLGRATLKEILPNIHKAKDSPYFPHLIVAILESFLHAFTTLDEKQIVHGDIKLENFLVEISERGELYLKLFDLGIAKSYKDFREGNYTRQGSETMSPEIDYASDFAKDGLNAKLHRPEAITIFEMGTVLAELLLLAVPPVNSCECKTTDETKKVIQEIQKIKSNSHAASDAFAPTKQLMNDDFDFDNAIKTLVLMMRDINPLNRPTATFKYIIDYFKINLKELTSAEKEELRDLYLTTVQKIDEVEYYDAVKTPTDPLVLAQFPSLSPTTTKVQDSKSIFATPQPSSICPSGGPQVFQPKPLSQAIMSTGKEQTVSLSSWAPVPDDDLYL